MTCFPPFFLYPRPVRLARSRLFSFDIEDRPRFRRFSARLARCSLRSSSGLRPFDLLRKDLLREDLLADAADAASLIVSRVGAA